MEDIGVSNTDGGVDGNITIGNANTSQITFDGALYSLGGTGNLTVQSASGEKILFTKAAAVEIKTTGSDSGTVTFEDGSIQLADATPLTINTLGGAVDIHSVYGEASADEDLTINANHAGDSTDTDAEDTETITIGAIGSGDEIGAVTLTAADGITFTGNIELSNVDGSDLDINGKVFISGDVTIDTDNAANDGTINFSSTIDGVAGTPADDLIILAGDGGGEGGALTITGNIGDTVALTTLSINAGAGNGDIAFTVPQIGGGGAQGVTGAVSLGNTGSGAITFAGSGANAFDIGGKLTVTSNAGAASFLFTGTDTVITADGGIEFVSGAGSNDTITLTDQKDLTLASTDADIVVTGVVGVAGNDGEDFTITITDSGSAGGTATVGAIATDINDVVITANTIKLQGNITTELDGADAASIDLNGAVVVDASTVTLTTGNGTIDFSSTVDSTASANNNLTVVSGTGTAIFNGAIGTGTNGALGNLNVNGLTDTSSGNITITGNIGTATAAGAARILIGNGATGTLALDAAEYFSSGGDGSNAAQIYTANAFTMSGTDPDFHSAGAAAGISFVDGATSAVSYTHLRAHET